MDYLSLVPNDILCARVLPLLSWRGQACLACASSGLAAHVRASRLQVSHIRLPRGAPPAAPAEYTVGNADGKSAACQINESDQVLNIAVEKLPACTALLSIRG